MDNDLQARVDSLEAQMAALHQASSIPYDVDYAYQSRGFLKTSPPGLPGGSTDYLNNAGFNSGTFGAPVLAFPIRWVQMQNNNSNLYIPLFTYEELG